MNPAANLNLQPANHDSPATLAACNSYGDKVADNNTTACVVDYRTMRALILRTSTLRAHSTIMCADEESLPNLVRALRKDDARARRVAGAGRDFAATHLKKPARLCYWRSLIRALADAFDYT